MSSKFQQTMKSYKECISKESIKTAVFGKYVLVFLNIFYMVKSKLNCAYMMFMTCMLSFQLISVILIFGFGIFGQTINEIPYHYWISTITRDWIISGVLLFCVALFGLIGAFRENIVWTNTVG